MFRQTYYPPRRRIAGGSAEDDAARASLDVQVNNNNSIRFPTHNSSVRLQLALDRAQLQAASLVSISS
jgi:hypothetical protein